MPRSALPRIVERKGARTSTRRAWDVYHPGVSDTAVLEIVTDDTGISVHSSSSGKCLTYFSVLTEERLRRKRQEHADPAHWKGRKLAAYMADDENGTWMVAVKAQ